MTDAFYHVTLRGNHQHDIFFSDGDPHLLNKIVARAIEKFDTRAHAFCWMRNHLHLLLQVADEPLARPMRQIAAEYARAMQIKLATTGHFFERRYHASLVDTDCYLKELVRYIHLNPVRAGVVAAPSQYRWSSHHSYTGARGPSWVTTDFVLGIFGQDRASAVDAYRRFLDCPQDEVWEPPSVPPRSDSLGIRKSVPGLVVPHRQSVADLIAEACRRFDVNQAQIDSPVRDGYMVKVRAWIAHQAVKRQIATISTVARAMGRDEATLRYAIRAYPNQLD